MNPGFFSDPKIWISLFSLGISVFTFIYSLYNQSEQNRRWDIINLANPAIRDMKMVRRKQFQADVANRINWGYPTTMYREEGTDVIFLPYFLKIYDANSNQELNGANPVFTMDEARAEATRLGFTGSILVRKHLRAKFDIENIGKTEAKNFRALVEVKPPGQTWQTLPPLAPIQAFGPGVTVFYETSFSVSADTHTLGNVQFKFNFQFEDMNGQVRSKTAETTWISESNVWANGLQ